MATETGSDAIVTKIEQRADPSEAGMSLQAVQKRELLLVTEATSLENMRKVADVVIEHPQGSRFRIICDEGPYLGGDDSAPPPLAYYSAALAFCLLTQLSRYATVKKLKIDKLNLRQEMRFAMEGSIIQGTLTGRGVNVVTHIDIKSDEPEERIRKMLEVGENSCFIMQSVVNAVPTSVSASLNGKSLVTER